MTEVARFYRLRIRNAADTADELVLTSVRGGTNPYIAAPPTGDGKSFNPTEGTSKTGSYTVLVADVETTPGTRVVTSKLADAAARQQLISRRAFLASSPDGSAWTEYAHGYVNGVRFPDAMTVEFAIGDSRRVEVQTKVFKSIILRRDPVTGAPTHSRFNNSTFWVG